MATHLILGGAGFIGRHVALVLARAGHEVVIADRAPPPGGLPGIAPERVAFRPLDLGAADWDGVIAGSEVIHHYAWSTVPASANDDPLADLDTNLRGTLALLEAVRRGGRGQRIVFSSSGGTVYGRLSRIPVPETHPLDPMTAYGVSKVAAEKYLGLYHLLHGLDCRIARISNPFGAGQDPARLQGAASAFVHKALAGEPIAIWGDGEVVRDYVHVSDVAIALARLAGVPLKGSGVTPVINVASGAGVSLNQIVAVIEAQLRRPVEVTYGPGRRFDVPVSVLDVSHAEALIGWSPRLGFEAGIARMIADCRAGLGAYSSPED